MALISCPECGHEVSDRAPACPSCAYPLQGRAPVPASASTSAGYPPERPAWRLGLNLLARLGLGAFLFVAGADGVADAAMIGGVVIMGSAIPAWFRGMGELRRGGSAGAVDQLVAERVEELDRSYQAQLDDIEERHARQVEDLEERLDFTERMITKHQPPGD